MVRLASPLTPASFRVSRLRLQPSLGSPFVQLDLHAVSVWGSGAHRGHQIPAQQGLLPRHNVKNSPHCLNPRTYSRVGCAMALRASLATRGEAIPCSLAAVNPRLLFQRSG
jgi:hypothetical protein